MVKKDRKDSGKLQEILERQDLAWVSSQDVRERSSDDLMFSRVTQWDDSLDWCGLEYRGEFNLIWKERQRLLSEMRGNDIEAEFKPLDGADPDAADILNGLYRTDMRDNRSKEAVDVAVGDMIDAGFGAWRLITEYQNSDNDLDNRQVIKRVPIHEANNVVFFDPNAKRMDKSDARYCTIITTMTKEGAEELCEELGCEMPDISTFSHTAQSYVFPWSNASKTYSIGEYYEREKKTEKIVIMEHPALGTKAYKRSEVKDVYDDMLAQGWRTVGQKTRDVYKVNKYIVSGSTILHGPELIAGEHIPVVPCYGNWYFVEGVEVWSGITRLAKDPQRLYNMQMSYLADIASGGLRRKPILTPEQVQGYAHLWEDPNKYRYLLLNSKDAQGNPLPGGPVSYTESENVPEATVALIQSARQNVEDVTSPGMPQDVLDPAASGKAIMAVQNRIDNQSFIYLDNLASAMRRDGEIYASMARVVIDTTREVVTTDRDGSEATATLMEQVQDMATGEWVTLNDLSRGRFDVYVDVGPAWASQRQQTRAELMQMMTVTQCPQLQSILQMQYLMLQEGQSMEILRTYARRNLLKMGVIEPSTEEDIAYMQRLQQQAQAQGPDPQQVAVAQALQAQAIKDQAQAEQAKANTVKAIADAEKARAQTAEILADTDAQAMENADKLAGALRGTIMQQQAAMRGY